MTGRGYTVAAALYAALAFIAALTLAYLPVGSQTARLPDCVLGDAGDFSASQLAAEGQHWSCRGIPETSVARTALVRFDLGDAAEPTVMRTRIGLFDRLDVVVVDADGSSRSRSYGQDDVRLVSGEPQFIAPLPELTDRSRAVFVQTIGARHDATPLRAVLFDSDPTADPAHLRTLIVIALLLGLVIAPVVFDLAFYGALRSPFLLWHAALSISFGVLVLLRSGLIVEFVDIPLAVWRGALIMGLGLSIATGAMFTRTFIEKDRLDPRLHRALAIAAAWSLAVSAIHTMGLEILRPLGATFHSIALLPVLVLFIAVLADAWRKGSRAVRFQVIGWLPLLLGFAAQLVTYITQVGLPTDALPMFYLGTLSETTITAIGVADRFFSLRRERDEALDEAQELTRLSERDPLTGLLNRRAIDARFTDLHHAGYETFALLDLDYFKRINDTAGHAMGDEVLRVVAAALAEDSGVIAIRLGGEEFLLLMRGKDAEARAERLRKMVSLRVARKLPHLGQVVTASMGLLVAPRRAVPKAVFSDIYSRADHLLYEAKANGRNRTVAERMQAFSRRGEDRRDRNGSRRRRPDAA